MKIGGKDFAFYDDQRVVRVDNAFNDDSSSNSRPNNVLRSSRGRISQVLAEARASLKEPSRPHTPASLDARTSIDVTSTSVRPWQQIQQPSSVPIGKQLLQQQAPSSSSSSSTMHSKSSLQSILADGLRASINANTFDRYENNFSDEEDVNETSMESKPLSLHSSIQIVLCDMNDGMTMINECIAGASNSAGHDDSKLKQLLENIGLHVDKIVKYVKSNIETSAIVQKDINLCINELSKTLLRILNSTTSNDNKQVCSRYILRLQLSRVHKYSNSSTQSPLPVDVATVILSTSQSIYQVLDEVTSKNSENALNESIDGEQRHDEYIDEINSYSYSSKLVDNQDSTITSAATTTDGNILLQGSIDLLLELLSVTWQRLPGDVKREVDTEQRQQLLLKEPNDQVIEPFQSNNSCSTSISNSSGSSSSSSSRENGFLILLESAVFAAGALRIYSNEDTNRRRLLHLGAVKAIADGFRVLGPIVGYIRPSKENKSSIRIKYVLDKLSQVVVQLIAAYRNFSLDNSGKSQMLDCKAICILCSFAKLFKDYPDVLLNITRVTAKLSLFEPFRTQINSKSSYIKYLVEVVNAAATQCTNSSTGDNIWCTNWHTWPILSRTTFTLANLTTSNDSNRTTIGIDCKCLKSLLMLLKACTMTMQSMTNSSDDRSNPSMDEFMDGTIKLLRLLANLCMDPVIGSVIATRGDAIEMLNSLMTLLQHNYTRTGSMEDGDDDSEELLLNIVATATNISFYACQPGVICKEDDNGSDCDGNRVYNRLEKELIKMTASLSDCLFHENEEIVLEAARALGNLTRLSITLSVMRKNRTAEALVLLLHHKNMEMVVASTGALVNISSDAAGRADLISMDVGIIDTLVKVLRQASLRNVTLSSLTCQVVYNVLLHEDSRAIDATSFADCLDELVDCMEEIVADANDEATTSDDAYVDFLKVGKAVLIAIRK